MEEKILSILKEVNEEILSYAGSNMMADGVMDSFELIDLIGRLEDTFDIEIDAAEVAVENFANKDCVVNLVKSLISD